MITTWQGTVAIVTLDGYVTSGPPVERLEAEIERLFVDPRTMTGLLIDCTQVMMFTSDGLSALYKAYQHAARFGHRFALVGVTTRVSHILEITQLSHVFTEIYPTLADAHRAFESNGAAPVE